MKRRPSILPRTALVFLATLGAGSGAGYLLARGDSHGVHLDELRRAARAANVNARLMCAILDASRDRRLGVEARASELSEHHRLCAEELYEYGEKLNRMPELAVAAFVTDGRFVPFALAHSHLPEEELIFGASSGELRRFLRRCLRRWAELEGRASLP